MADAIDLTGDIQAAIDGSLLRGAPVVVGYVDGEGKPSLSYRGSAQVYSKDQLAVWARNPDDGFVKEITNKPDVALLFLALDGTSPRFLSIRGRARLDPSANETVYTSMVPGEQERDPDRKGVAVLIDVDSVIGAGNDGQFQQSRD
jgi:hypothetical protein